MLRSTLFTIAGVFSLAMLALDMESPSAAPVFYEEASVFSSTGELNLQTNPVLAETLSYVSQAGQVLIFNLPENIGQRKIDAYRIRKAPALSWVVKRSFFWRTLPKDAGKHEVLLQALVNGLAVEQVVVLIDIR